ncbi:MAG: flagellar basal body P-ring formation chaperone FlgA [Chthoniobacteraceae bacterium]
MRTPLLLLSLAGAACAAGPLDRILDPLPKGPPPPAPRLLTVAAPAPRPVFSLTANAFVAELEKQVAQHFTNDGELKISLARSWPALRIPEADWVLIVTEWPIGGLAPAFVVRVKVVSGSETVIEGQLPLRAQLWQDVWFANRQLERGQPLDRESLATQKADVLRERIPLVPASADPSTLELAQSIAPGKPLTRRDVNVRPLIRKGQLVEVVAKAGALGVRMKALALENGAIGDLITLRNVESRKEFNGHVTHDSKVQVQF